MSTDLLGGERHSGGRRSTQNILDMQESKLISFFGRVNYNINDKYSWPLSLRRDGSSRFGAENAWGTFPSVSVGWRLSEESFMREHAGRSPT